MARILSRLRGRGWMRVGERLAVAAATYVLYVALMYLGKGIAKLALWAQVSRAGDYIFTADWLGLPPLFWLGGAVAALLISFVQGWLQRRASARNDRHHAHD